MSELPIEMRTSYNFRYEDPTEAYKIARRRITNNARRRRQRSLDLSNFGLTELPPEIGELDELQYLHIRGNRLNTLPSEIGQLRNLVGLYASKNNIAVLPVEISTLLRLRYIDLEDNKLQTLPRQIGELVNLRGIELQSNLLAELPLPFFNLVNLESLDISNNEIAAIPDEIGRLRALDVLAVGSNHLTKLPAAIEQLKNLQTLDLAQNKLKTLPGEITNLARLTSLKLDDNQLSELPETVGLLRSLQELSVRQNLLTDLPTSITALEYLRTLFVTNNQISKLPNEIGNLRSLISLAIGGNRIEALPASVSELANLGSLRLDHNAVSNLPSGLERLMNLTILDVRANRLKSLPDTLTYLPSLRTLRADKNAITEISARFGEMKLLQTLSIEDNQISDLPKQLGQTRSLDRAAMSSPRSVNRGLYIGGNPLIDPYPLLIAHGQPSATTNVLAWLRGELDSSLLQGRRSDYDDDGDPDETTIPPAPLPEIGPNLRVVGGKLDLSADNDAQGEYDHLVQSSLHIRLNRQLDLLKEEAQRFSNQHPLLARTILEYGELVSQPLESVDVVGLWTVGNALIAQSVAYEQRNSHATSEPLEPHQQALLLEATRLHGGFILGFPLGAELTQRSDQLLSTPQKFASIGAPTSHVLGALSKQRVILSDRARKLIQILEGALFAAGWKSTRAGYSSYVTVRNFLIEMGKLAVLVDEKGSTLSGGLIVGTAITVSGINAETFAALVEFFRLNASEVLAFAAPFPELRAWIEWIVNHLDGEKA